MTTEPRYWMTWDEMAAVCPRLKALIKIARRWRYIPSRKLARFRIHPFQKPTFVYERIKRIAKTLVGWDARKLTPDALRCEGAFRAVMFHLVAAMSEDPRFNLANGYRDDGIAEQWHPRPWRAQLWPL